MMVTQESSPSFFVKNSNIHILKSFVKVLVFFSSALYLLGYAITGFNLYYYSINGISGLIGTWDNIVPFERVLTLFCSISLSLLFIKELTNLWRLCKNEK